MKINIEFSCSYDAIVSYTFCLEYKIWDEYKCFFLNTANEKY